MGKKSFFGVIIIGIIYIMICLTGCWLFDFSDKHYYHEYKELNDGLTGIEIVYISPMSDFKDMTIIETLEENEIEECLRAICGIEYTGFNGTPAAPSGYCIKLNYSENYILLGYSGGMSFTDGRYYYKGEPLEGELLLELISKYVILEDDI